MKKKITEFINTPIQIGSRTISKRLLLAPMSGLGHVAFREMATQYGGFGLLFTEMCNAKSVPHENRYLSPVFRWRDKELPFLVCQIFGSEPGAMAKAAQRIEIEGFFGVDINFGCSVAALCKKNYGAALLKTPDCAVDIVQKIRQKISIPLFVKYRTGWEDHPEQAVLLARRFEDAGADALTFHPRVAPDRRSRPPKWEYIAMVKDAVTIPVFGNGQVFTDHDVEKMINMTGCDGISLGRIAVAKPWIFAEWADGFIPDSDIYRRTLQQMLNLMTDHFDMITATRRFKKMAIYTAAMFKYGHEYYKKIMKTSAIDEIAEVVDAFFDSEPLQNTRPNLNLFI